MARSPARSPAPTAAVLREERSSARGRADGSLVRAARKPAPRRRASVDPLVLLWRAYRRRRGNVERNALVETYQSLVAEVVKRYAARLPRRVDTGDLATAANVGLMAAVESFDAARGVPFESYCELRIRGALLDELRSQDWLPRPWRSRVARHKRALEELRASLGREPRDDEICAALELSLEDYRTHFGNGLPSAPGRGFSAPGGDGELSSLEIVPDTNEDPPDERLTREELLALVAQKLSPQECRIVYLKYWDELPMREIGELEGLSESRVCKIHARLLERLKERFRVRAGDAR